jgi:tetratricopeptide (TPR) repeat protein
VLEALANALRVSPVDLVGRPYETTASMSTATNEAMRAVEDALNGWWLGEVPDAPGRPWPQVQADVDRLNRTLRPSADYAAVAALLPGLIRDLLAAAETDAEHRRAALVGLIDAYNVTAVLGRQLGFAGLRGLAMGQAYRAAEELDDPVWISYARWLRAHHLGGGNRARQYQLAVAVADAAPASRPEIDGMANLTAALASAARGDRDTAETHLAEAASLAELIDADVSPWGNGVWFGRTNVGVWRVSIGVELGEGARVAEVAASVRPHTVPKVRQADYWTDYGRALLTERKTRERGLAALLRAESLAPQKVRSNVFVREAVTNMLAAARRDAGGRELRAWLGAWGLPRPADRSLCFTSCERRHVGRS